MVEGWSFPNEVLSSNPIRSWWAYDGHYGRRWELCFSNFNGTEKLQSFEYFWRVNSAWSFRSRWALVIYLCQKGPFFHIGNLGNIRNLNLGSFQNPYSPNHFRKVLAVKDMPFNLYLILTCLLIYVCDIELKAL